MNCVPYWKDQIQGFMAHYIFKQAYLANVLPKYKLVIVITVLLALMRLRCCTNF